MFDLLSARLGRAKRETESAFTFEIHLHDTVIITALLLSMVASLTLLFRALWRVVYGIEYRKFIVAFYTVVALIATSLIAVDLLEESRARYPKDVEFYPTLLCLMVFVGLTFCFYQARFLYGCAATLRRKPVSWALILVSLSMSFWCYHRIQKRCDGLDIFGLAVISPGIMEENHHFVAMTDKDTRIPLYRMEINEPRFEAYSSATWEKFAEFRLALIHRDAPDKVANCHGWVFTDGQFLLKGRDVKRILSDNGYYVVVEPAPNDLLIYRNETGEILHTAKVQAVLNDGTVISESKWGIDQRFLHLPAGQPYSQVFCYYRTDRPNHLLQIRKATIDDDVYDD